MIDDRLRQLIENAAMVVLKRDAVELAAEVQVPGVEYPHFPSPHKIYTCNFYMDWNDQSQATNSRS